MKVVEKERELNKGVGRGLGTEGEVWKKERLEKGPAEKEKVNRIALLFGTILIIQTYIPIKLHAMQHCRNGLF